MKIIPGNVTVKLSATETERLLNKVIRDDPYYHLYEVNNNVDLEHITRNKYISDISLSTDEYGDIETVITFSTDTVDYK